MLVLDTEKTLEFVETIEVIAPSHQAKVLRFVEEILENTKVLEQRIKRKESQDKILLEKVSNLEEQSSVYEDEEEEDEAERRVSGTD